MRIRREVPHTLAGAYVLDALTEPDRVRFERHLAGCEACRQEAASLREAAGRLAAVPAVPPPPHVREQVLTEAARTRQQPPLTADALAGPGRRAIRWRAPRMAVAIAGGCILVALVLGGLFIHTQRSLSAEQAHNRAIATILNAPDATIMSAKAMTSGSATVVMSHRDHALVLTTAMLPALPAGQRYQVWLMGTRRTRPAGMLPVPHRGMTAPVVVSGVAPGDMVGLTVESASGSTVPSSAPVLMLVLPF
ncbi:MAG TPA: anti-sigma factor [Streptosporangiaceae bacterium]|nr:anti-sigma factor [Streptosporangiaceae bacterium]